HAAAFELQLGDGSFRGELRAVFAAAEDFTALAHAPGGDGSVPEILNVVAVDIDEAFGQQHVDRFAHDFRGSVPKDSFRALVEDYNPLVAVDGYDRVVGEIQNLSERIR